jgi:hypothetical protein
MRPASVYSDSALIKIEGSLTHLPTPITRNRNNLIGAHEKLLSEPCGNRHGRISAAGLAQGSATSIDPLSVCFRIGPVGQWCNVSPNCLSELRGVGSKVVRDCGTTILVANGPPNTSKPPLIVTEQCEDVQEDEEEDPFCACCIVCCNSGSRIHETLPTPPRRGADLGRDHFC